MLETNVVKIPGSYGMDRITLWMIGRLGGYGRSRDHGLMIFDEHPALCPS